MNFKNISKTSKRCNKLRDNFYKERPDILFGNNITTAGHINNIVNCHSAFNIWYGSPFSSTTDNLIGCEYEVCSNVLNLRKVLKSVVHIITKIYIVINPNQDILIVISGICGK